eukprot:5325520-Amphidinium_carterae.1
MVGPEFISTLRILSQGGMQTILPSIVFRVYSRPVVIGVSLSWRCLGRACKYCGGRQSSSGCMAKGGQDFRMLLDPS